MGRSLSGGVETVHWASLDEWGSELPGGRDAGAGGLWAGLEGLCGPEGGWSAGPRAYSPASRAFLSPDPEAIRGSMDRALALCDESGYQYYQDQLEKGYYKRLISGNVLTRAVADSVVGDFSVYPYRMAYYGRQLIMRASQVTVRSLVTTCRLANAVRSDANPHGFQLQDFTVVENRDLQVDRKE